MNKINSFYLSYFLVYIRNMFSPYHKCISSIHDLSITKGARRGYFNFYSEYLIIPFKIISFIGIKNKNQRQWEKFIGIFEGLQIINPINNIFINENFESFRIFPIVKARNKFGKPWPLDSQNRYFTRVILL